MDALDTIAATSSRVLTTQMHCDVIAFSAKVDTQTCTSMVSHILGCRTMYKKKENCIAGNIRTMYAPSAPIMPAQGG